MLFCSGWNFVCPFCMNSSLIPLKSGVEIDSSLRKSRIMENIGFLDVIGATGGEPGLQPKSIVQLYTWAKFIKTFINTNRSHPDFLEKLLSKRLIDHIAMVIKSFLIPQKYRNVIGVKKDITQIISNIWKTLELVRTTKVSLELRTSVVSNLIDAAESIRSIARLAKKSGIYILRQFFPLNVLNDDLRHIKSTDRATLVWLAKVSLQEGVQKVYARTRENGLEGIELA